MNLSLITHRALALLVSALVVSCRGEDTDGLANAADQRGAPSAPAAPRITGEAKVALDSGNVLFRARAYDLALEQYRRSAQLIPTNVTPLFGVLMVAEARKDTRLADSVRARIRELNPSAADSSAVLDHTEIIDRHSRVKPMPPPAHPTLPKSR